MTEKSAVRFSLESSNAYTLLFTTLRLFKFFSEVRNRRHSSKIILSAHRLERYWLQRGWNFRIRNGTIFSTYFKHFSFKRSSRKRRRKKKARFKYSRGFYLLQRYCRNIFSFKRRFTLQKVTRVISKLYSFKFQRFIKIFGLRLDTFLRKVFFFRRLAHVRLCIDSGHVFVNGQQVRASAFAVRRFDVVHLSKKLQLWLKSVRKFVRRRRMGRIPRFKHFFKTIRRKSKKARKAR